LLVQAKLAGSGDDVESDGTGSNLLVQSHLPHWAWARVRVSSWQGSQLSAYSRHVGDFTPPGDSGVDAFRAQLESQAPPKPEEQDGDDGEVDMSGQPLTGEELRGLVVARWGRPYDTRITQRRNKINQLKLYLQVRDSNVDMLLCWCLQCK